MLKTTIKIGLILIISIAIEAICLLLQSHFLVSFLTNKIVEIQITLIAINVATSSFIVSKLQELAKLYDRDFADIYDEIKWALYKQIGLIIFSIICLTLRQSEILYPVFKLWIGFKYIFGVFIIFSFACSMDILRDMATAMFEVLLKKDNED